MSYGFSCGYCRESLDTPFHDAGNAETFADMLGWRLTLGHTDAWGGNAHNTCPNCAPAFSQRIQIAARRCVPVTGLLADAFNLSE